MYQSRSIWKLTVIAVSLSVLLHLLFVVYSYNKKITWEGNYESVTMAPKIIDVEFIDEKDMPEMETEMDLNQNNEKITNQSFNAADNHEYSEQRYDSRTEKSIQEQVEKELREFEANEFNKLKDKRAGENKINTQTETKNNENKNASNGEEKKSSSGTLGGGVTAMYELKQRRDEKLAIPAYICKGAGKVKVNIIVDREGLVVEAVIDKKGSSYKESCIGENALAYAKRSRFSVSTVAPVQQEGWILYTFIAQ